LKKVVGIGDREKGSLESKEEACELVFKKECGRLMFCLVVSDCNDWYVVGVGRCFYWHYGRWGCLLNDFFGFFFRKFRL
jgi:hypothetical protein